MTRSRPSWDATWMSVAIAIAQRSRCSRDQVGAVVVSPNNRLLETGYNGPPAGFKMDAVISVTDTCQRWCPRALKQAPAILESDYGDCPSLHAEANALMFGDRSLREGGTIYVTSGTCSGCSKLVANSGLVRAVYMPSSRGDAAHYRDSARWFEFLRSCGLRVDLYDA